MSRLPSEAVECAIALLRANPTMTRYEAARKVGITPGALYNSHACRAFMKERAAPAPQPQKEPA